MKNTDQLTGILHTEDMAVPFTLKDFKVTILPPKYNTDLRDQKRFSFEVDENGFIHGRLYTGKNIAIFVGKHKIECLTEHHIHIGLYMLSSSMVEKPKKFKGVCFEGDTINNIVGDWDLEAKDLFIKQLILNDIDSTLSVAIGVNHKHSRFGEAKNLISRVSIEFDNAQPFESVLSSYNLIDSICKFMTYRNNSFIDEFYITAPNDMLNGHHTEIATCYMKPINTKKSDYYPFEMLMFNDIKLDNIQSLFLLFDTSEAIKTYLNFLPEDKDDANYINIIKIKEICAALECELNYVTLSGEEDTNLDKLKKQIKEVIKLHRTSDTPLSSDKTYDRILGDMKHWDLSLADKVYLLSEKYVDILVNIGDFSFMLSKDDINTFVKLRNDNSHGNFTKVSSHMAKIAYLMIGLVYCCLLERIGLNHDEISNAIKKIVR